MNLNQIKQSAWAEMKTADWTAHLDRGQYFEAVRFMEILADRLVDEIEKLVLAKWCQHDTDTPCASCFKTQDILRETFTRFKGEKHD